MEKIELCRVRDFGALFNDSVAFIRINFRSFFGILLVLAGPFIILTGLLSGYMQSLQSKLVSSGFASDYYGSYLGMISANFIGTLSIFLLIYLLTTLVTSSTVCLYLKIYDKTPGTELPLDKNLISPFLASTCWRLFHNYLSFILLFVVGAAILTALFAVLFIIPVLNILAGIALVIGALIIFPPMMYVLNAATFVVVRDEITMVRAIGKIIDYMKGNFWWTWLLMIILLISLGTISSLFSLPLSVLGIMKTFVRSGGGANSDHSVLYLIFGSLNMITQMLIVVPISMIFCVFNYYNHEEQQEGTGLMDRIDEIDVK
ncbi:MAG: hypothetical protein ACXVPN_06955 [Bacteroidia bacterium]